jgi:hypothetical protein
VQVIPARVPKMLTATATAVLTAMVALGATSATAYALPSWKKTKPNPNFKLATVPWITAVPGAPGGTAANSATFKANINPQGSQSAYCFDYGLTGSYDFATETDPAWEDGETDPVFLPGVYGAIPVVGYVFGLRPGTVYHYTVQITNAGGDKLTADRTFRTAK